jgi:hypothetical protein
MTSTPEVGTRPIFSQQLWGLLPIVPSSCGMPCWKRLEQLKQFLLEKMTMDIGMR